MSGRDGDGQVSAELNGLGVFVVEDEQLIVMLLDDMLSGMGARITAKARTVPDAVKLASEAEFEIAILDLNLGGTRVFPVAERLLELNKPFVFASGYGLEGIPDSYSGTPTLAKPYQDGELANALLSALELKKNANQP